MKYKLGFVLVILAISCMAVAACSGSVTPAPAVTAAPAQPAGDNQPAPQNPPQAGKLKIRVATDATFPPFESVDQDTKEIVGFDIDLLKAVAEKANLELEFVVTPFDPQLLDGVAKCEFDAAASAMTITDERKRVMLFSDPYFSAGQIISVLASDKDITGKDSLKGKKVGVQLGTTGAIEVNKIDGVDLVAFDDIGQAFKRLEAGDLGAVVVDDGLARAYVAKSKGKLKTVGQPFTDEAYGFAVCKTKPDLLERINMGLKEVKAAGLIDQLNEKWFMNPQK